MKERLASSTNLLVKSAPPPDEKPQIDLSALEEDLLKPSNADLQLDQIGAEQAKERLRSEHANAVKLRILLSRQKETNYVQEQRIQQLQEKLRQQAENGKIIASLRSDCAASAQDLDESERQILALEWEKENIKQKYEDQIQKLENQLKSVQDLI